MEVIMRDNTVRDSADVMPQLIESAVQNALEYMDYEELQAEQALKNLAWEIVEYHEIASQGEIRMDFDDVLQKLESELSRLIV
jgi:hypothetical protein